MPLALFLANATRCHQGTILPNHAMEWSYNTLLQHFTKHNLFKLVTIKGRELKIYRGWFRRTERKPKMAKLEPLIIGPSRPQRPPLPPYLPEKPYSGPKEPRPLRGRPALTKLACKYTHPTGDSYEELQGMQPLKSGLTPIELDPLQTIDEYLTYWSLQKYQRDRFKGLCSFHLLSAIN